MDMEFAARAVLLESLSKCSPWIEETFATNACGFVLDITGSERLFGPPETIARNLRSAIASAGFRASVCVSNNFDTARICAEYMRGVNIISIDHEARALASIPVAALRLEEPNEETFALW
jgi:protein ImuB